MGEPHTILALALNQPDMEHIEQTICQLKLVRYCLINDKYLKLEFPYLLIYFIDIADRSFGSKCKRQIKRFQW